MQRKWRQEGLAGAALAGAAIICAGITDASMLRRKPSEAPYALLREMGAALKDSVHRIEDDEEITEPVLEQPVTVAQVDVYKPRVESPVHLIKIKIADYCDKNALDWTQIVAEADILSEMTNQRLRRQYGCEEGDHEDCNL